MVHFWPGGRLSSCLEHSHLSLLPKFCVYKAHQKHLSRPSRQICGKELKDLLLPNRSMYSAFRHFLGAWYLTIDWLARPSSEISISLVTIFSRWGTEYALSIYPLHELLFLLQELRFINGRTKSGNKKNQLRGRYHTLDTEHYWCSTEIFERLSCEVTCKLWPDKCTVQAAMK